MPLAEGIRGPDKVRFCSICQEYQLQLIGSYHGRDEDGRMLPEPTEFSHLDPCPVCEDKIKKGEIDELRVA